MFTDIYSTENKYKIIYADPPWRYNARKNLNTKFGGGAAGHYKTMTLDEIGELPVKKLADINCALFLWTTFPYLNEQIKLFERWGFIYKTLGFSWIKTNSGNGKPFFGVGYYAKSNCELCLLGIKGRMKPVSNNVSSCIIAPREEHSKKPDETRERIMKLFGNVPKIELFARQQTAGWDYWGDEIN